MYPVDEPVDDGYAKDARRLEVGRRRLPVFRIIYNSFPDTFLAYFSPLV